MSMKIGIIVIIALLAAGVMYFLIFGRSQPTNPSILQSPNFVDGAFRNSEHNYDPPIGMMFKAMWEFLFNKKETKPEIDLPKKTVDLEPFINRTDNELEVAWLGHSSLMINMDGYLILADPVLEKSVSFFGPTRYNGDSPIKPEDIPAIDLVLISHDHYDHLNKYTIELIHQKTSLFIVPLGVGDYLREWGVSDDKIIELDWWKEHSIGNELTIASTPAQHFSGRGLTDRNKTLWTSFVVKSQHRSIFFGGDSGYFGGFKEIGDKYGSFAMTFLECGAYNKKWAEIHMMPEEVVQAHIDLKGEILHPIHWGTFDLATHPWYEPMQRLTKAAEQANIKVATPIVGGTTNYNSIIPDVKWWEEPIANSN